jgi:predicted TIM-barrel fold metal-dependent hydrolase
MSTQARVAYELISADSHFNEPPDVWVNRVPAHLRDRAPHVERIGDADYWVAEGERKGGVGGLGAAAARDEDKRVVSNRPTSFENIRPGAYDPRARLEDMDGDGVWAEVIYPTTGLGLLTSIREPELRLATVRAYNDWVAEFNRQALERLCGLGVLPTTGVGAAIAELRRLSDLGFRGAVHLRYPSLQPLPTAADEPFWSAAEEIGLPVHVHLNLGRTEPPNVQTVGSSHVPYVVNLIALASHGVQEAFAALILSGVFERYPRLRMVSVEGGIGWIPYLNDRLDHVYRKDKDWADLKLTLLPSEYWRRQVWATFQDDVAGVTLAAVLPSRQPPERLMWASDYPHSDTTWPNSRRVVAENFQGLPDEIRARIVWQNAAELYEIGHPG